MNRTSALVMIAGAAMAFICTILGLYIVDSSNWVIGISFAYGVLCGLGLLFVAWYCRWYWSDSFVKYTARRANRLLEKGKEDFVHTVIDVHPRADDIRREMGQPYGQ